MAESLIPSMLAQLQACPAHVGLHLDTEQGQRFLSYRELSHSVRRAAAHWRACGLAPGSRVILPFATTEPAIVAFLSLIAAGALPLSVKTAQTGGPRAAYDDFLQLLSQRFGARFIVAEDNTTQTAGLQPLDLPAGSATAAAPHWHPASLEDIAFAQFSSGTTSTPKGVPIRHGQLLRQLDLILAHDSRGASDVGASWLPLFHDMGLVGALLSSLRAGHPLHLWSPQRFLQDPTGWVDLWAEHGVTVTAMPNFGLAYLLRRLAADELTLPPDALAPLRRIYLGSDTVRADTVLAFQRGLQPHGLRNGACTPCYGMAEAVLMVSCARPSPMLRQSRVGARNAVSVGPLLPSFDMRLVREDGAPALPGEVGEILLRGGTLAERYLDAATPLLDTTGHYRTGDLGFVEDGELFITGRIGDTRKINGQRIDLLHLEHTLHDHPEVRHQGVVLFDDDEALTALVEPVRMRGEDHAAALRRDLIDRLYMQTGVKLAPERLHFVRRGQIPRTSSGKLQRARAQREFIQGRIATYQPR